MEKHYVYLQQSISLVTDQDYKEYEFYIKPMIYDINNEGMYRNIIVLNIPNIQQTVLGFWEYWRDIKETGTSRDLGLYGHTVILDHDTYIDLFDANYSIILQYFLKAREYIRKHWIEKIQNKWKQSDYSPIRIDSKELSIERFIDDKEKQNALEEVLVKLSKTMLNDRYINIANNILKNILQNEKLLLYNIDQGFKDILLNILCMILPPKIRRNLSYITFLPRLVGGYSYGIANSYNLRRIYSLFDIVLTINDWNVVNKLSLLFSNRKIVDCKDILQRFYEYNIVKKFLDVIREGKSLDIIENLYHCLETSETPYIDTLKLLDSCLDSIKSGRKLKVNTKNINESEKIESVLKSFNNLLLLDDVSNINITNFIEGINKTLASLNYKNTILNLFFENPHNIYMKYKNLYNIMIIHIGDIISKLDINQDIDKIIKGEYDNIFIYKVINLLEKLPSEDDKKVLYNYLKEYRQKLQQIMIENIIKNKIKDKKELKRLFDVYDKVYKCIVLASSSEN